MKQRTLDEMITYFNQQVSEMDIDRKYKMALLGMITAIGYQNKKQERKWETCFDCPLSHGCPKINGCTNEQAEQYAGEIPEDCPIDRPSGADMRDPVEIARDIAYQAIYNTIWSDTVDIAKMHKAVDDKYVEMEHE